jgi:hypothetical protein
VALKNVTALALKHDRGAGDRAGGGCGRSLDEALQSQVFAVAAQEAAREEHDT